VVYVTDANFAFDVLKGLSVSLQPSGRIAPRYILVGIGYPSDCPLAGDVLRVRDMTFPGYPKLKTDPPPIEGVLSAEKGAKTLYGAEDFQRFIEQELFSFIDRRYPTVPGDRAYFGHSLGGGFGLSTLFTRPELFNRYIISSASLSFRGTSSGGVHYEECDFVCDQARAFIGERRTLDDVRLYISVGGEEELEPALAPWQMTSSFMRMLALLKFADMPGLHLTAEIIAGGRHMTVWPVSFIHGVQAVFTTEVPWMRSVW
jgi:predicted alpha/beta superfamily hydrolase